MGMGMGTLAVNTGLHNPINNLQTHFEISHGSLRHEMKHNGDICSLLCYHILPHVHILQLEAANRQRDLRMLMQDPSNVWFPEWCAWLKNSCPCQMNPCHTGFLQSQQLDSFKSGLSSVDERPPNLAVSKFLTGILQDGSMRISYDEFRFYIYDMLGSNKAGSWGDLGLHNSIIVQTLLLEKKRQCWKVSALRSISKYIQSSPISSTTWRS